MVAVTPRVLKRTIWKSKLARNAGASYGYDLQPSIETVEKLAESGMTTGSGMASFGGGLTSFGGMAETLMGLEGGGLYPFGTGIYQMGSGMVPAFGMGILSKLKGAAKSAAKSVSSSVLRGTTVKQLKNAVMDAGKKKIRHILPAVLDKVKTEINKQAPGLVTRLTSPALNKLPSGAKEGLQSLLTQGVNKGLEGVNKGLALAQDAAMAQLSGSGIAELYGLSTPSSETTRYNRKQLEYMNRFGIQSQRGADAGEAPKKLILDKSSRSLADSILADRGYEKVKRAEFLGQVDAAGGALMYHSLDYQPMDNVKGPARTVRAKKAAAKPKGRPRGSGTKGKGIVYL